MKALARILAFSTVKNVALKRILHRAWSVNEAFLHRFPMCFLYSVGYQWQFRAVQPLELLTFFALFPVIFKTKEVFCLSPRITKLEFTRVLF